MGIITTLQEITTTQTPSFFEAKDGHIIHIELEDAQKIIEIHDSMNQTNQEKMRELLEKNKEDYIKILMFCENHLKGGD